MADLAKVRKRRGVATRIETRLNTLEGEEILPTTRDAAHQILAKLKEHDADFKKSHLELVDLVEDNETLIAEQATLDEHDDIVARLTVRILALAEARRPTSPVGVSPRELLGRRCARLESRLSETVAALSSLSREDVCRLQQHQEQLVDFKRENADISNALLSLTLDVSDALPSTIADLEKRLFDCSLRLKELSRSAPSPTASTPSSDPKGIKLPKLEVPAFNGNILNWRSFWEQFVVAVHNCSRLSNAEKLVYLQQALKGGTAKNAIEGLSRSSDNYDEAIQCLKARYDRPRLIHQAHVKAILEAAPLKDGTGREIRKLHDTVLQHLRALKSMGHDPSGPFITSTLELKLDQTTMFEWQKHSLKSESIPPYQVLLEFLNLRAQATESSLIEPVVKKGKNNFH